MPPKRKKAQTEPAAVVADRTRRLEWFREARFGMFVHYGVYAQLGRGEWAMNRERIPVREYEQLATAFAPKADCADEWARTAKSAGMKYAIFTTKHHDGFCLWDTKQTTYNSVRRGPKRDLVAEHVAACRRHGLRVGLYYSLMDWHHPDGARCYKSESARRRFVDFTHACVRELMSAYGKIDVVWFDVLWPLKTAQRWESEKLNAMIRALQPDILINNRAGLEGDFGTPEGHIKAEARAWESCMTFNGSWGYVDTPDEHWLPASKVCEMLRQVATGGGNLLLNIGPEPDGSVPPQAVDRLARVGKWLKKYRPAIEGAFDPIDALEGWAGIGWWTRRGNCCDYWITHWPGERFGIGGLKTKVQSVSLMGSDHPVRFKQTKDRLLIYHLPQRCPDRHCGVAILQIEFAGKPRQFLGEGTIDIG